jgi:hypothetical protein
MDEQVPTLAAVLVQVPDPRAALRRGPSPEPESDRTAE